MKRDCTALEGREFDVLVVGGGIHGAAVARECACSGLRVLLVEKCDFGHATSANSLKILHGGLRYLQHLNIKRMRESICSRREMMRLAPQYVQPLGCLIPNTGNGIRGNFFMRLALLVNDLIGADRNSGVRADVQLPGGNVFSAKEGRDLLPGVAVDKFSGASLWHDALVSNSERMTLAFVQAASNCGGVAMNYTAMQEMFFEQGRVAAALLRDELTGREFRVGVRAVVHTSGPWLKGAGQEKTAAAGWAKAVNIIVRKTFFGQHAVGLTGEQSFEDQDAVVSRKGRFFFFVPWRGYTMIGTTYKPYQGSPGRIRAEVEDIRELVEEVNSIYPRADLSLQDVTNAHAGLVPMYPQDRPDANETVQLVKESSCSEQAGAGAGEKPQGVFTLQGVKYTTAPSVAAQAGSQVRRYLEANFNLEPAAVEGKKIPDSAEDSQLPSEFAYLQGKYGELAHQVYTYIEQDDTVVGQEPLLYKGELEYFLQEEMACTLADVVFRRSELGTAECPDKEVLQRIACHMAEALGWDETRQELEIGRVLDHFTPLLDAAGESSGSSPEMN